MKSSSASRGRKRRKWQSRKESTKKSKLKGSTRASLKAVGAMSASARRATQLNTNGSKPRRNLRWTMNNRLSKKTKSTKLSKEMKNRRKRLLQLCRKESGRQPKSTFRNRSVVKYRAKKRRRIHYKRLSECKIGSDVKAQLERTPAVEHKAIFVINV